MKIRILGQEISYSKNIGVDAILADVDRLLENSGYFFSHMIIDGLEVYENIEEHIHLNRDKIKYIDVQAKTVKEFSIEILRTIKDYIQGTHSLLNQLIDQLYHEPKLESWQSLTQFIEALQWINEALYSIERSSYQPSNWQQYTEIMLEMNEGIGELEEGIQNKDAILIGDIIQYELMPRLEELALEVETTFINEGMLT